MSEYLEKEFIVRKMNANYNYIRTPFGPYTTQPIIGFKFKITGINSDGFASRIPGEIYLRINSGIMITYKDLQHYLEIGVIEEFIEPHTIFKPIVSRLAVIE